MKNSLINRITLLIILLLQVSLLSASGQERKTLKFRADRTFKIVQFTDLHWKQESPGHEETASTIRMVLEAEKPDLAILTGDIVTAVPAREGWLKIARLFSDAGIQWCVTLGNHDGEPEITRDQIFGLIGNLPCFVGLKGPDLSGCGNYILPVASFTGKTTMAVIYCFDSNDYATDKAHGKYDWIRFDQVAWYRSTSDRLTSSNKKTPLPSIAFFHIPLQEYSKVRTSESTIGSTIEEVASPEINSGLFASFIEKKDVMGIFVGHDHDNNYIGTHKGVAMAYGQVTGKDAYGDLERGGRIIVLHEGEPGFETWIRTRSGISLYYKYLHGMK